MSSVSQSLSVCLMYRLRLPRKLRCETGIQSKSTLVEVRVEVEWTAPSLSLS